MYHSDRIFYQLDSLLERAFDESIPGTPAGAYWKPALDMYELKGKIVLLLELPAVKKKDIAVTIKDDILTISGVRHSLLPKESHVCHRIEIQQGRFFRSFKLVMNVKRDEIIARFHDGILKIEIPKEQKR